MSSTQEAKSSRPAPMHPGEALWEVNFGAAPSFALGVEEELLVVGADNELRDQGAHVAQQTDPDEGAVTRELFKSMLEVRSEISANAAEAVGVLRNVRTEMLDTGVRLIGSGLHPNAQPGESVVDTSPRFAKIEDSLQGVLRAPICGLHFHIGMPDKETAVRVYNGIRTHVPLLNALAANSPFWGGRDSGLASTRTVIFRSYPRAAMAPQFQDYEHFCRVTEQVCVAAGVDDYTHIWWDVRIHPMLGTIEIRAADAQFDLRRTAALAALVHCLTRVEAEREQANIPVREALAESSFQATRHGLDADLLDRDGCLRPARELARETTKDAASVAGELGCEEELQQLAVILAEGTGADVQRAVHAERGMDGLLEFLVQETAQV